MPYYTEYIWRLYLYRLVLFTVLQPKTIAEIVAGMKAYVW